MDQDTHSVDGPECPHCGHTHDPSEEPEHYYNEGTDVSTCDACGKEFGIQIYISHSWTCRPLET